MIPIMCSLCFVFLFALILCQMLYKNLHLSIALRKNVHVYMNVCVYANAGGCDYEKEKIGSCKLGTDYYL